MSEPSRRIEVTLPVITLQLTKGLFLSQGAEYLPKRRTAYGEAHDRALPRNSYDITRNTFRWAFLAPINHLICVVTLHDDRINQLCIPQPQRPRKLTRGSNDSCCQSTLHQYLVVCFSGESQPPVGLTGNCFGCSNESSSCLRASVSTCPAWPDLMRLSVMNRRELSVR